VLLGIETTQSETQVGLAGDAGVVASRTIPGPRNHVEALVPAILGLLADRGMELGDVARIAVDRGPGLFTSLRVGVATAKTLAHALGVPVAGVCSLDVLAWAARETGGAVCACLDARRGQVFAALYRDGAREGEIRVLDPDALARELRPGTILAGDGAQAYPDALGGWPVAFAGAPPVEGVLALATEFRGATALEPLYVRRSEAEINWEERGVVIERPSRVKIPKRALEGRA